MDKNQPELQLQRRPAVSQAVFFQEFIHELLFFNDVGEFQVFDIEDSLEVILVHSKPPDFIGELVETSIVIYN